MPDVIDLVSSDPPATEQQQPQAQLVWGSSHHLTSRHMHPSHSGRFSSDSIDVSIFNYDDTPGEPAKKRRRSKENPSPLRKATLARETTIPKRGPSLLFSDDDFDLPPSNPAASRTKSGRDLEESDPIVFTSSAPQPPFKSKSSMSHGKNHEHSDIIALDDSDDDFLKPTTKTGSAQHRQRQDEIEEFSDPFSLPGFSDMIAHPENSTSNPPFSSKTAGLLASLSAKSEGGDACRTKTGLRGRKQTGRNGTAIFDDFDDDVDEPAEPRRPAKKSGKLTSYEKESRARARAEAKAQKDIERELEKQRKQKLKEEKAKQKQLEADISEVNKLKVDKKDSTPEMIVELSSSFEGSSVGNQAIEFMKRLGVDHNFFPGPIPNIVKWRRKRNARYNEAAGHWEPCAFHIQDEKHVLCLVPAQDFVDMVIPAPDGEERESLELHVLKIKSAYPGCTPIYLIEGLTAWMRKNRNSRNRAYQAEVLRQYEQPDNEGSTTSRGRGRKTKNKPETTPPVDDDTVEDALLTLQVTHSCLIHHTNAPPESAEWIKNFTEHISTIPYRRERMEGNDAAFCMDVGQVKSGEDKLDTFVKMLQEVNRVTASMAYGIAGQYPSVSNLVRSMRMHGPTMLEDVRVRFSLPLVLLPTSMISFPYVWLPSMLNRCTEIRKQERRPHRVPRWTRG